jgi:hypothetical protein
MGACNSSCGYCGRCSAWWERDAPDSREDDEFDAAREAAEDAADNAAEAAMRDINIAIRRRERVNG